MDKAEEVWNQPMFSHFSNMILWVGRKHELRLGTYACYDQFVAHRLQLPTYATSLSLPTLARWPSGFSHIQLDPATWAHICHTHCTFLQVHGLPSPSTSFLLFLETSSLKSGPSGGVMLIDLNQVLQEAAPQRQVLTDMLYACMLNHFVDCYLPDSSVHGILQTRILEWVASPLPGDLPHQGIKPESPVSLALAGGFFSTSITWEAQHIT